MQRVLCIRLGAIGDIVMTSLALRCFRKKYPDVKIDYLTKNEYSQLVCKHLDVDEVISLKGTLWETAKIIALREYDYVIDLHANLRSIGLKQLLPEHIKVLRYKKYALRRQVSVWLKRDLYQGRMVPEQYLDTLKSLKIENDGKGLSFYIPKEDMISPLQLPLTHRFGYIVLSLGAKHFTKRMPREKWEELCKKLDYPIILIGGKDEIPLADYLVSLDEIKIISKCGQYNIGQSASVMSQAKFVVVLDTGMMHIAAALKVKTVSIWGGTVPSLGFRPYGLDDAKLLIVENKKLELSPLLKVWT
ncbi:MAG: glycosyltransferase family 9 protein [Chitinophagales bacterium]|nr:glycosyltransferase family 9 protein [Chitinophagales bacterium]